MSRRVYRKIALLPHRWMPLSFWVWALAIPIAGADEESEKQAPTAEEKVEVEDKEDELEEFERFVVTGTRIKEIDLENEVPIIALDRRQIEESGVTQLSELIGQLPITSGASESGQIGSFAGDGAQANLRGTGVAGTLVLLNGRRMVPYAFSTARGENFVDLNAIPVGAIERIEILKDGGSAIYGSDALSGVINFILRKDYEEGEIRVYYESTTREDDVAIWGTDVTWGKTTERASIIIHVNYYQRDPLMRRDRTFSASPDQSDKGGFNLLGWDSYPGFFEFLGLRRNPADFTRLENHLFVFFGDGSTEDMEGFERFNYNTEATLVSGAERYGISFLGSYEINNTLEFFGEFSYQDNAANYQLAPAPLNRGFIVPASNPFNPTPSFDNFFSGPLVPPGGLDITDSLLRPLDPGPRKNETDSELIRLVAGLKGEWGGAQWELSLLYGKSVVKEVTKNLIRVDLFQEALNATGADALNPFASAPGEDNNAAIYNRITTDDVRSGNREFFQINAGMSKELFTMPAGPVIGHFGVELRDESMNRLQSELAGNFLLFGSGGTSAEGSRNVYGLYGEMIIPLHKFLEGHFAARWEEYSDFGDTVNPKVGVKMRPFPSVLLRASYSEAFRAPSLEQAFGGITRGFVQERDFLRTNFTFGVFDEGTPWPFDDFRSREVRRQGNPDLSPEGAKYFNAGIVYSPKFLEDLAIGFDVWRLEIDNVIATRSIPSLLSAEEDFYFEDPVNYLFLLDRETRGAMTGVFRDPNGPWVRPETPQITFIIPGKIDYVVSEFRNFEGVTLEGLDFEIFYRFKTETFGDFWIRHYSVYVDRYVTGGFNLVGFVGIPRYQAYSTFRWSSSNRNLRLALVSRYTSGYKTEFVRVPRVNSHTVFDLQLTYAGLFDTEVIFGIKNLTDRDPPANVTEEEGYDTHLGAYNPYGRTVTVSLKRTF